MDKDQIERLEKLEKQKRKQLDRQNKYINANYDRIGIAIPKGQKALIENRAKEKGFKNLTEYIKGLINNDLNNQETTPGAFPGFSDVTGLPFG